MIQSIMMGGKVGLLTAFKKGLGTTPDVLRLVKRRFRSEKTPNPPDDAQNRRLDDLLAK